MDTGHWLINEDVYIFENMFGFIYEITNKVNGKKYIGKKQCVRKIKRKPLKGKTRNRIDQKESDWKTYTSSSKELNEDIQKYGKDNFQFRILKICGSKWELSYEEIKEQIARDVLKRDDYYNGVLNIRVGRPPNNLIR
jgi:hypothetical protein